MKAPLKLFCAFALLACCIPAGGQGQTPPWLVQEPYQAVSLAAEENLLRRDVEFLSHALLGGRGTATRGGVEAAAYIARRLRQSGLAPQIQTFSCEAGAGHNIYAVHTGSPKSKRYTLICTHYDSLGERDGVFYPGADANASGVAVLLFLADALKESGANYIFAAFDAHHSGKAGAEAFCSLPYRIASAVSLDTIGSVLAPPNKYRPDFIIALGAKGYERKFFRANMETKLRIYYDYYGSRNFTDYFYRTASDLSPFLRKGIPGVMFTSGITMNTNKATDTASTLDYEILARRACFIRNWLRSIEQ